MILMPWFIYKIYPPEIKETPEAAAMAQKELDALGPITKAEISVAIIFVLCILLWATAIWTKLHPTVVAMMGVLACVVTGSLTWEDILGERTGWDILIWMGTLVGMAGPVSYTHLDVYKRQRQARQMVNHGHILVNGRRVDIPSFSCKPSDVIELREASRDNEMFKTNFQELRSFELPYIEKDLEGFKATFTRLPQREELPIEVNETLIVELYSK